MVTSWTSLLWTLWFADVMVAFDIFFVSCLWSFCYCLYICLWCCRSINFIFRQLFEILVEKIEISIVVCIHPTSGYACYWRAAQILEPIYGLPWDDSSYTHFTIVLWIIDVFNLCENSSLKFWNFNFFHYLNLKIFLKCEN